MTLARQGQVHSRHQNMAPDMVQVLEMDRSVTPPPAMRTKPSSVMQESPSQLPEPSMEVVVNIAIPHEMPHRASPGQDPAQPPPSGTIQLLEVARTKSAAPTTEAEHSLALQKDSTHALKHPKLTPPHPNLTPVTVQPLDVQMMQDATTASNICELCACENETLSCTGLSPMQRLHRIPALERNSFTVL